MKSSMAFVMALAFALHAASGQNLLVNGNFDAGNSGFTSTYQYHPTNSVPEGGYAVVADTLHAHGLATSFPDHTSGKGLMLCANGSRRKSDIVWRQVVSVTPQRSYSFSGWGATWGHYPPSSDIDPSPPSMLIFINGTQCGGAVKAPAKNGQWQSFTALWDAGAATEAAIEIRLETTAWLGNDIALDDFIFAPLQSERFAAFSPGTPTTNRFTSVSLAAATTGSSPAPGALDFTPTGSTPTTTNGVAAVSLYRAVEVEWESLPGRTYQVQWADTLPTETWFNLGSPVVAAETNTSVCDRVLPAGNRFYRVLSFE